MSHLHWEVLAGTGPPVLFVHGFLMGNAQWQPNTPGLTRFCTPVLVELFGHAGSPSPADAGAYHPDGYVAEFEAIRQSLGVDRWMLCGYSLGGGLTVHYALTHPESVMGHVFTNSSSGFADADQVARWREGADAGARRILSGGVDAIERIPVHPKHARHLPADLYEALCDQARRHDPVGIANTIRYTTPRVSVRDRIAENVRPALMICGIRERRFETLAAYVEDTMPHLSVVRVDAGHGVNMEAPAAFNAALHDFVDRCTSSTS